MLEEDNARKEVLKYVYDNLLAIITVITALIALWQTHKQIKISNKQYLFKNRMDKYITFKGFLKLYCFLFLAILK